MFDCIRTFALRCWKLDGRWTRFRSIGFYCLVPDPQRPLTNPPKTCLHSCEESVGITDSAPHSLEHRAFFIQQRQAHHAFHQWQNRLITLLALMYHLHDSWLQSTCLTNSHHRFETLSLSILKPILSSWQKKYISSNVSILWCSYITSNWAEATFLNLEKKSNYFYFHQKDVLVRRMHDRVVPPSFCLPAEFLV